MRDHIARTVERFRSLGAPVPLSDNWPWRVPVLPQEVNQLPDGRRVRVGLLARTVNDHFLAFHNQAIETASLRSTLCRAARRSPEYVGMISQSEARKPLLCSWVDGKLELIDGANRLDRLIQDRETEARVIVVPAGVLKQFIVRYPNEADLASAARRASSKTEVDQRALRLMKLNHHLAGNPIRRASDETGAHVKLFLVSHENDNTRGRAFDRETLAKQKQFTYIQELRLIAAHELNGKNTKESEDIVWKAVSDPSDSRLRARRAAIKKFTNFRNPTDFKNQVKRSLCSAKESGVLDQIISEMQWSLDAQSAILDRAGRFQKFHNWLSRFVHRRNKIDPNAIQTGMLPPHCARQKFTPSIDSLLLMSIWTQVNQAVHYPDFLIYYNLFDMAVYFSRTLEESSPEMTASIAETLVGRMAIGVQGESDHLTPRYMRVFDLVDDPTFDAIFDRAVAYLDA